MHLTKEQAIAEHRKMWRWIAKETEKRQKIVKEEEYIKQYFPKDDIFCNCFYCEYGRYYNEFGSDDCSLCPLDWDSECNCLMCMDKEEDYDGEGLFSLWQFSEDWKEAAELAKLIAELPERKEI